MILAPFGQFKNETRPKKFEGLIDYIMRDSLKANNKEKEILSVINEFRPTLAELVNSQDFSKTIVRDTAKMIREMGQPHGPIWELCFNLSLIYDIVHKTESSPENIIKAYSDYYNLIYKFNLSKIYELKPMIDGKEVIKRYKKTGPAIKKVLENIFFWQVENPGKEIKHLEEDIEKNKDQFLN